MRNNFLNLNMETTTTIKEELKQLIDLEKDPELLISIKDLLTRKSDDEIREKLISRAYKAIEDIKAGRVYKTEEVIQRTNYLVGK